MSISPPHAPPAALPGFSQPSASQPTDAPASAPFAFSQAPTNGLLQPTSGGFPVQAPGAPPPATPAASTAPPATPNGPAFGSSAPAFGPGASAPGGLFTFGQSNAGFGDQSSATNFRFGAAGDGVPSLGASQPAVASAAAPGPAAPGFPWGAPPQTSLPASNGFPAASGAPPASCKPSHDRVLLAASRGSRMTSLQENASLPEEYHV